MYVDAKRAHVEAGWIVRRARGVVYRIVINRPIALVIYPYFEGMPSYSETQVR